MAKIGDERMKGIMYNIYYNCRMGRSIRDRDDYRYTKYMKLLGFLQMLRVV